MKTLKLSDSAIKNLFRIQSSLVADLLEKGEPSAEQVTDLMELCRVWLEGKAAPLQVTAVTVNCTKEQFLQSGAISAKDKSSSTDESLKLMDALRKEFDAPLPAKIQINTERAVKAVSYFRSGTPRAIKESGMNSCHYNALRNWLASELKCSLTELNREIAPASVVAVIRKHSADGVITIPYNPSAGDEK